jgi:hypothetical protein
MRPSGMPRYKTLQSVAHNFGQSFTSLVNYYEDDFLMGHLLRRARQINVSTLTLDLLTGQRTPPELCDVHVSEALDGYVEWFPDLVRSHESDVSLIKSAQMEVAFDLPTERPDRNFPKALESPYRCTVDIVDDRGKHWQAELSGWWSPEPMRSSFADRLRHLLGRLRLLAGSNS